MEFLKVKNWERFQHYADRNPPWIKLHVKLLNDRNFSMLACASKGLLMLLWVLASEYDGRVPYDLEEIQFRLRDNSIKEKDLNLLIDKGFLIKPGKMLADASEMLADASGCSSETETETETENSDSDKKFLPIREVVHQWNLICARLGLPAVKSITQPRKKSYLTRLREEPKRNSIDHWVGLFNYITQKNGEGEYKNPHLMGQNSRGWTADFDFVISPKLIKIEEGSYERAKT